MKKAQPAREEQPRRIVGPLLGFGEHGIAHQRERPALDDVHGRDVLEHRRFVLLKELWRVDDEPFDAEWPGAQHRYRRAKVPMSSLGSLLVIDERRVALKRASEERRERPVSAGGDREAGRTGDGELWALTESRLNNRRRNRFAKRAIAYVASVELKQRAQAVAVGNG